MRSKNRTSTNKKRLKIQRVLSVAVWIVVPPLTLAALVVFVRPKLEVMLVRLRQEKNIGIYAQAPPGAILAYTQDVPLRFKANRFAEVEDTLYLPSNQQTGLRESTGYLMESDVGGIRVNPDESVWIVVIRKDENRWLELYAPGYYFKVVPGTGKVSFMEDIKFY
jgi:hypothetical protein